MTILWKNIKDYENYSISNTGRVRNNKTNRLLKFVTGKFGFSRIGLYKNKVRKNFFVHQLVATNFLNKQGNSMVRHLDNDKQNNCVSNLIWTTAHSRKGKAKGYYYHKYSKMYTARIFIEGKQRSLGYYKTAEEASEAYKIALKEQITIRKGEIFNWDYINLMINKKNGQTLTLN